MRIIRFLPFVVCIILFALFGFTLVVGNAQERSPLIGQPVPEFFVSTTNQQGSLLSNKTIQKPSIIVFWASWCGICKVSLPGLSTFAQKHNIPLYSVAYHDQAGPLLSAINHFGSSVVFKETGMDFDGTVASKFGIVGVPTLFVIDKNGIIRAMRTGLTDERDLNELIEFLA